MRPQLVTSKSRKIFLQRRSDFLKTYKGRFVRKEFLVVYARPNKLSHFRFGITVPRATGTAVVRNRFKRWTREFFRKWNPQSASNPHDVNVFVGSKHLKAEDYKSLNYSDYEEKLASAMAALF